MKVFAVNSSPRNDDESLTALMLQHLVVGMREAGAEVTVHCLREKKINACTGCYSCWTKTPGRCIHGDDMTRDLLPGWLGSDLAVHATPLYYHTMNAAMSRFMERTLPVVQPFFHSAENGTYHPLRCGIPGVVWLSVCGFPEFSEFNAFSDFLNRTRHRQMRIVAEIYRPAAGVLRMSDFFREKADEVFSATEAAGRELVEKESVSPKTLARVTQPVIEPERFVTLGNVYWKTCIAEGVTPRQYQERKMVARPDSLESFLIVMEMGLDATAAGERRVVLGFDFSGQVTESCHFILENGGVRSLRGKGEHTDLHIAVSFDLWMDILTGKADGQEMMRAGRFRVEGDLALMASLFQSRGS